MFVDGLPGPEAARRFGYTPGSLQQLVHRFRQDPERTFFMDSSRPGIKADVDVRDQIIRLRKQNLSVYDISEPLKKEGTPRTRFGRLGLRHGASFDLDFHTIPFHGEDALVENLRKLNQKGVQFITLRRRSPQLVRELQSRPRGAWRRIELEGVSRQFRTPPILDERIELADYKGPLRQIAVTDLGHEEPTLLLTNQLQRSAAKLIGRYARRTLIENNIQDGVGFFHIDALSSAVALKVNCDVQVTLMASSLYRHLGQRIGSGYETAKSQHLFRDFIDATAILEIDDRAIWVRYQKRAHNPLLLEAGFDKTDVRVPWLGNKQLRLVFG